MSSPGKPLDNLQMIDPRNHLLMFVVRQDGEPGLYVAEGVTREQVAKLLEMMAGAVRSDPRWDERSASGR